jgi:hypothetical protein
MSVMVNPDPETIPGDAVIIGGCITEASGGHAADRLVAMNVEASHRAVHVVAHSMAKYA